MQHPRGGVVVGCGALVLCEVVAPALVFAAARREISVLDGVVLVALAVAVAALATAAFNERGRLRGAVGLAALVLFTLVPAACGLHRRVWWAGALLAVVLAAVLVLTTRGVAPFRGAAAADSTRGVSRNYLLESVLHDRFVWMNGAVLLAASALFTVESARQGLLLPVGFALIAVNSPLTSRLAADADLRRQYDMLGRPRGLLVQYAVVLFVWFAFNDLILAAVMILGAGGDAVRVSALALVSALVAAVSAPLVDVRVRPSADSTVRQVWKHPRKYIVPAVLLLPGMALVL